MSLALRSILVAASERVRELAREKSVSKLVERDLQRAMEHVTGARSARLDLDHWPSVGRLDLLLDGQVGVELKWCRGGDALGNCAWDVAKLATSIAEGELAEGFIVAGAPAGHWSSREWGVPLFTSRVYDEEEIVREYERWWRFWCSDVLTRPIDLPRSFAVISDEAVEVDLLGTAYSLKSARVEVRDSSWWPHVCPHRWRGERCRPRPRDPTGSGGLPVG